MVANILLVYTSLTGNTEQVAELIHSFLLKKGHVVKVCSFDEGFLEPEDLIGYDGILFGTYTYEDGDLPYEVEDFSEDMEGLDLTGVPIAVFGSGDTFYRTFGQAIDTMADRFTELGASVLSERLKVDLDPDEEDEQKCLEFVEAFLHFIEQLQFSK